MPKLIKIDERIINLDTIAFVKRSKRNGVEVVTLFYERGHEFRTPTGEVVYEGTKEDPIPIPLNIRFFGPNAKYVWQKLAELAELWVLPDQPAVGSGWPD
jgi:hypothetical protein